MVYYNQRVGQKVTHTERIDIMIIFEWISNFMNTPKIELSVEDEIMFYIAIAIISLVVLATIVAGAYAFKAIKAVITKLQERLNSNRKG